MVTDLTPNQLRRRAARLADREGDASFRMLAAAQLGMPEESLTEAVKFIRDAMVAHLAAHPPRCGDDGVPGIRGRLADVGMLIDALGFEPEAVSAEEQTHGIDSPRFYRREREAMVRAGL